MLEEKQENTEVIQKEETQKATQKTTQKKKKLKIDKRHIKGFIGGILVAAILFTGVTASIYPGFLTGTFTRQIGNATMPSEVDLLEAGCEPAEVKAQLQYSQKFVLDIKKEQLKNFDKKHIQLDGLFSGMEITSAKFENDKLTVEIQGTVSNPHACGPDRQNPTGDIYIMPEAVKAENTAYAINVAVEYPMLIPDATVLEDKDEYDDEIVFILSGDTFSRTLAKEDVTLSGGFEGMTVKDISQIEQTLTINISGSRSRNSGNGFIILSGAALTSGFSVDHVINIAGAAEIVAFSYITTEEPLNDKIQISIKNDLFSENLTTDMFTLGGDLKEAKITEVVRKSSNIAWITIEGKNALKPGTGTITLDGIGVSTGRTVSGKVFIKTPEIFAYLVKTHQTNIENEIIYDVYSYGDDFMPYISEENLVLKGSLSGLKIKSIDRFDGYHIRLAVSGTPGEGDGIISVRSDAMGRITGAEANIYEVEDLGLLDMEGVSNIDDDYLSETYDMSGQTGGFIDSALEWGLKKVKEAVISGAKAGLEAGAKKGLQYFLRQTGLEGPPIEDMLTEIQDSINDLSLQMNNMEKRILSAINALLTQTQLTSINEYKTKINLLYAEYELLQKRIKTYKENNPGKDPYKDPGIKNAMEAFAGKNGRIGDANLNLAVLSIGTTMTGDDSNASLITNYYQTLKDSLPFEHNAISKLKVFIDSINMYQVKGALLFAEYCNYNIIINPDDEGSILTDPYAIMLEAFTNEYSRNLDAQESLLPSLDLLNIRNVWGNPNSNDIKVKCNENSKTYIIVGDTFKFRDMVLYLDEGIGYGYYIGKYWEITRKIFDNRGGINIPYDLITEKEKDVLFEKLQSYNFAAPYTFLDVFAGDNGKTPNGWLYLNDEGNHFQYGLFVRNSSEKLYNMFDGSTFDTNAWYLHDNMADKSCKVILVGG
ncbi:MAG: hypothetical protein PHV32_08230 [Eubacteriales bacterium]|nr:hypothetical protein [Eubacteriales bacterium]